MSKKDQGYFDRQYILKECNGYNASLCYQDLKSYDEHISESKKIIWYWCKNCYSTICPKPNKKPDCYYICDICKKDYTLNDLEIVPAFKIIGEYRSKKEHYWCKQCIEMIKSHNDNKKS